MSGQISDFLPPHPDRFWGPLKWVQEVKDTESKDDQVKKA